MTSYRSCALRVIWIVIFGLMLGQLRVAALEDFGGAQVRLGAVWSHGGCPEPSSTSPTAEQLPEPIRSKCEVRGGSAAVSARHFFQYLADPEDPESCLWGSVAKIGGSCSVSANTAGCEVDIVPNGDNKWKITIAKPKRSGSVSITATIVGECKECPPETEHPCEDCEINDQVTFTATGTIQVDLPPEDEDDDDGPDGGCDSCKGNNERQHGIGSVFNNSVGFRLNLGRSTAERDAGHIALHAQTPSADLAQPVSLEAPFERPGVEVLNSGGAIKQVKSSQGLIHIAVKDQYEYYLQCFYDTNLTRDVSGAYIKTNGFYGTNAPAYATWIVKNPDGSSANSRLWISEQRDGLTRDFKYTYTSSSLRWDLLLPDAQTTISTWKARDTSDGTGNTTNYFRQTTFNSTVVRKVQNTYLYVTALADKVLTQKLEGDGGVTRITTYTNYPSNASGGNANRLQRVDYPDGNWVYYNYDAYGRVLTEYSAYGNNEPPNSGVEPVPLTHNCKMTEYAYTLTYANDGVDDDGSVMFRSPRLTIVKIPASGGLREVSRAYHHFEGEETGEITDEIRSFAATDSTPTWDDPGYLSTTTSRYADGKLYSVLPPDDVVTEYYYFTDDPEPGFLTTIISTFSPAGNGTETTTVVDEMGLPISITKRALVSGSPLLKLSEDTYNYKDGNGIYLDPLRRSYDVTDLAGRKTQYRFNSCCGYDYTINPENVTNRFDYDILKRQVASTVFHGESIGIKTTNILDAAGSVLVTKRIGTDGSTITLGQFQYDVLGRVIRQTNALNGVTTNLYAIVSGRSQEITLNPDGGTRTNTYYRDGQIETVAGTATSGVKYVYGVEQDGSDWRQYTKQIKLDASYAETAEWTKTYADGVGRSYKTVFAAASGTPASTSYYDNSGQVWKRVDADGVVTLYEYNSQGELEYTAVDVNLNDAIDFSGTDRIKRTEWVVLGAAGGKPDLVQVNTYVWKDGDSTGTPVSSSETSTDGLRSWNMVWNNGESLTSQSRTVFAGSGYLYTTNIAPDNSYSVSISRYGTNVSATHYDSLGGQLSSVSFAYDAHGRQNRTTDARNGTSTNWFNNADQVSGTSTPVPAAGQSAQLTTNYFDTSLRVWKTTLPDNSSVTNEYFVTGMLKKTYGSRTYPVEYTYEHAGRMKTMKTWQDFVSGGPTTTTWNYDSYRGWLANKRYVDSTGPDYTYTAGGRLKTRSWARFGTSSQRIVTTYKYGFDDSVSGNQHGDLTETSYTYDPQSTPTVTTAYDRLGRPSTTTQGSMTTTLTYNDASQQLVESYSGGALNGLSVTNGYDQYLRRTNMTSLNGSDVLARTIYGYDAASQLKTVGDGINTVAYGYVANSPLVGNVWLTNGSALRMTTTKSYDYLNRPTAISSVAGGSNVAVFNYANNSANQRTAITNLDNSRWVYQYDALGQVVSGKKYWSDGTPVAGQQFEYGFDDIGNRKSTAAGGDAVGANLRYASYTNNSLNQISSRSVPGYVNVVGTAKTNATVTLWADNGAFSGTSRKGEYFRGELAATNTSTALWLGMTNLAVLTNGSNPDIVTNTLGNTFLAQTPEAFYYDLDGNLTNDGHWTYTWDAENRLVLMVVNTAVGPPQRISFGYDWRGRRVSKAVWNNTTGSGQPSTALTFMYDDWNLIAELASLGYNAVVRSYSWGVDLSGSLQGAGGVGGLLLSRVPGAAITNFFAYDGHGNVAALVNAASGDVSATYEYGPFGEVIRASGPMAKTNPFRFSTKYQDDESDCLYYGYRSYNPSTGRWLSRDTLEEDGGLNLCAFVLNSPIDTIDLLGQAPKKDPVKEMIHDYVKGKYPSGCYKAKVTGSSTVLSVKKEALPSCRVACCPIVPDSLLKEKAQEFINSQLPFDDALTCPDGEVCCPGFSIQLQLKLDKLGFSVEVGPKLKLQSPYFEFENPTCKISVEVTLDLTLKDFSWGTCQKVTSTNK